MTFLGYMKPFFVTVLVNLEEKKILLLRKLLNLIQSSQQAVMVCVTSACWEILYISKLFSFLPYRSTGETVVTAFDVDKMYTPLFFARVKSYTAFSERPLQDDPSDACSHSTLDPSRFTPHCHLHLLSLLLPAPGSFL